MPRQYVYYLNQRGALYHLYDLHSFVRGIVPSGPASIHDPRFLDFFFSRLRLRSERGRFDAPIDPDILKSLGDELNDNAQLDAIGAMFPFVSLCGKECNYLAVQDAPVVFHAIDFMMSNASGIEQATLSFAGSMKQPLDPELLRVDSEGKLFHPITGLPMLRRMDGAPIFGLLGSQVGFKLGFDFVCDDTDPQGNFVIEWAGERFPIQQLASLGW